jgi:hypothetical protein
MRSPLFPRGLFFKRRRGVPHKQNDMARMSPIKQKKLASGPLFERFPDVAGIMITMTYYQKGTNPVLMLRTVHIKPVDFAYFHMECMIKGCLDGGFNLAPVIVDMVKKRKKAGKGKLVCNGKIDARSLDHASVDYEISIDYKKAGR